MWVELSLLFVVLVTLAYYTLTTQKYTKEGIPIIGNIPWLGCGIEFNKNGPYFLQKMAKKYGDLFQIYVGGKKLTFFMNEDFYRTFYKSPEHEMSFYGGLFDDDSSFGLNLILNNPHAAELTEEEKMEPLPSLKFLKPFAISSIPNLSRELYSELDYILDITLDNKQKDLLTQRKSVEIEAFKFFTNSVTILTTKLLIGDRVAHNKDFLKHFIDFQRNALDVITKPLFLVKKQEKIASNARYAATAIIQDSIDKGDESFVSNMFKNATYSTGKQYAPLVPLDSFGLVFAAIANTNAAATNCIIEILANEQIKQKILEEMRSVIPPGSEITHEKLSKLVYLDACITETLRLYSPPIHVRKCLIDVKDQNDKVVFQKGEFVCISPFLRHRDPNIYSEPEKFIPERHIEKGKKPKFSFLTFGQGSHFCIGKPIAEAEIKLSILKLFSEYEVTLVKDYSSTNLTNRKLNWFTFGVILSSVPTFLRLRKL